ncbi:BamA/OMP85 family outer membrane protein [Portibacter lacus]|uniref:Outer membrane protein assembly factor BamA n=1 Tax=Portibacter lacus TaxID=1099794 RepID=A0AA37WE74_9BACT|nr:POTRA domain-containing protein [Portibacter lacus]GLR18626.1 outer membrane protein assembly factor BamA [Portibacter lacus]
MKIEIIKSILFGMFLFMSMGLNAQDVMGEIDYDDQNEYEIGGVNVYGPKHRDPNAIISISGLTVGKKITVPGPEIPKAIKSLLRLRLFSDVKVIQERVEDDIIFLGIELTELPILARYSYNGVKKVKHEDLNEIVDGILTKGGIVTEDLKELTKLKIKEKFISDGFLDTEVEIKEFADTIRANSVRLEFDIDKKDRVRIQDIVIHGNEAVSDRKLRKKMENTKKRLTLLKKSKFKEDEYEDDKKAMIAYYNTIGFRDAKIVKDSVYRDSEGKFFIDITVSEGNRYVFRDIVWKGNSLYSSEYLGSILGIEKGDVYNEELLNQRIQFAQDGRDVSSLYMDDGYLFFRVDPTEISIENDSIDLEMRIYEGPQATIDRVNIAGNDRTHEHVVRRMLRTKPGAKFSRSDIIRSQREIINLGYFNPENMDIGTPVDPQSGTVDIEYQLEERPSDQLELSAGYGGFQGLVGTLGVTFNNFSLRNITDRSTWNPLPQGDGQRLSVRAQSNSNFYQSYNFSFTEPWLGGKKPTSLTVGSVYSNFDYSSLGSGKFSITNVSIGLGTQLKRPDDYFVYSATANIENLVLDDYFQGGFTVSNGSYKNFNLRQTLVRSSVVEPIFPRSGSKISLTLQLTPYYFWRGKDNTIFQLTEAEKAREINEENLRRGEGAPLSEADELSFIEDLEDAGKFEFLEYHKWKFEAQHFFNVWDKLVVMAQAKIGVLGYYRKEVGVSPFERFEVGGDGLNNQQVQITGKDIISVRGYETTDFVVNGEDGEPEDATIFNKFTVELRYPFTLNPNSTIYAHLFAQGANSYGGFRDYNPFQLKRSAGAGLRVFLPMFGLLGFDYGFGFDKNLEPGSKWTDFGKFSIVLGFEPE